MNVAPAIFVQWICRSTISQNILCSYLNFWLYILPSLFSQFVHGWYERI